MKTLKTAEAWVCVVFLHLNFGHVRRKEFRPLRQLIQGNIAAQDLCAKVGDASQWGRQPCTSDGKGAAKGMEDSNDSTVSSGGYEASGMVQTAGTTF